MILFPAVDIKGGKCVRLRQGMANQETIFGDPAVMAKHWEEQGARFLHVIDLDGSFNGKPVNLEIVRNICSELSIPVQLGGGVRNLSVARAYLDAGVERLIIGTVALEEFSAFGQMCAAYPGKFGVSLDTAYGRIQTRGWVKDTGFSIDEVLPRLADAGAAFLIFTDITLDGMQQGVNIAEISRICEISEIPVIAAGGVTQIEDVKLLYPLKEKGLTGIITGRAIYEETLDFKEAQAWIDAQA